MEKKLPDTPAFFDFDHVDAQINKTKYNNKSFRNLNI